MSQLLSHNYIMNYNFSLAHLPTPRVGYQERNKLIEEGRTRNRVKACQQIRYHPPFERLERRTKFQPLLNNKYSKDQQLLKLDNFALFDAVCKRGGYHTVSNKGKWQEINISLQYEKKLWGLAKHYQQFLLPVQSQLLEHFPEYLKQGLSGDNQTIEMHLIVPNNLTAGYYQITPLQVIFAESYFFSMDQYFNLKTLALFQPAETARIPVQYADKFMMLRKWLLFNFHIENSTPKELRALAIQQNLESNKIIIVGLSVSSLLIADKLSEFGLNIVIFDKSKKQAKFRDDYQLVENGLVLLEGGKQFGSYYSHLAKNKIELEEVNANCIALLGDDGKPILQEIVRLSEEHFFSMIEDLKGEIMNKKNLYEQITSRLIRKKLQNQRFLIKWHHDRYMMFNRLKGDGTTVGDLITYQNKRFVKHIAQPHTFVAVRSIDKLWNKVKQKKKVTIVQASIDSITYKNSCWSVNYRGQFVQGSHLIYSDHQTIYRGILENNAKFTEIASELMADSLPIFQQLTIMKYVNCLYKFSEKVNLKDTIKHLSYFSINCPYGAIFCYLLNNGTQILASLKCYHNSNVNYYIQILNILQAKIILNRNKILNEENVYAFDYSFGLKDQKYMESIIRLKPNEKMFCLLPITTTNCPHRMAAQLDMSNYLCGIILDECYPDYQRCDSFIRQQFKQNPSKITKEDTYVQPELIKTVSQTEKLKKDSIISNIPSLASGKNAPSILQSSKKQRVITAIANEDTSEIYQIVEGQIPSVFALHQLNIDWFGLKNNLVKGYETYIKNRVQVSLKIREGIRHINHLQITQAVMLSPSLYLYSFGQPYLSDWEWFNCLLPKTNKPLDSNYVFALNKMITRREYLSLQDTFQTTIYYQTILVVTNEIYYCLIDENNPNVIYYHKNISILVTKFNERLNQLRIDEINSTPLVKKTANCLKMTRCKMERHPPSHLLPSRIEDQIRNELKDNNDLLSLDQILENKLSKSHANENKKRYMGSEQDPFHPQQPIATFETQNQAIANNIYSEICSFLSMTQRIYEIKQFSLFELFFGILDEQHICCEIMKKFTENPLSFSELQKLDSQLGQQIQQIFSKNIPNEINSLIILPNQGYAMIHRNFMSLNRANKFQKYTYKKIFKDNNSSDKVSHLLIIDKEEKEFKTTEQIMRVIIKKLCPHFHSNQIISRFQVLINRQIENEANLTPLIKIYFRMTKKCMAETNPPASLPKFTQKFKELSERQKQNGYKLMKKKTLRWVQNDFVFMH